MKLHPSLRLLVVLAIGLLICATQLAFAQGSIANAQLSGTVTDQSGGAIVNAAITVRNMGTGTTYTATSNDRGFYAVANVPPGTYELKASYTGFANFTQTGILLTVGQVATVNVNMRVASLGEIVIVTSEVQTIEPTRSEVSQVVERPQIEALPTSSRLFTDFALLTPGVSTSRTSLGTTVTEFEVTQISFGGMRSFSNMITVDGADFVNEVSGVQRATPPQDSVQEFRVVNNSFGTEYGRTVGGIVNVVTKSGTNDLHGSLYEFMENTSANARSLLQPAATATQPALPKVWRQNQYGASLGGPLKKDKTFFFMNYEGHRNAYSPTYAPDLYNNIDNIDLAKSYLGLNPEGGSAGFAGLQKTLRTGDNDYGFARLDHQLTKNNNLALRYNIEDARDNGELIGLTEDGGGIGSPSGGRNLAVRDQSVVGTLSSSIRPNVVNTALVQFARRHYGFTGATGEPDLSIVNDLEMGHNFGIYDSIYESRLQGSDSISWVKGNHVAKFGADWNYLWDQNNYPGFTPTRILIPNLNCLYAFADSVVAINTGEYGSLDPTGCPLPAQADGVSFLYLGLTLPHANCPDIDTACSNGFYNGYVPAAADGAGFGGGWPSSTPANSRNSYDFKMNHGYFGAFFQDQWRIKPSFTLNYGVRWDVETGLGYAVNSYYKAFQPRVGFAWSPDSKTVIRGGYGLFFDRNNMTFFFVTGNQKTLPGYFCGNGATPASCGDAGLSAVKVPMINNRAASGGWQLGGEPGYPGTPALGCIGGDPPGPLPPFFCAGQPGNTLAFSALTAWEVLAGAPYPAQTLTGPCTLGVAGPTGACGVGSGGIQKNGGLPYAHQASFEIDRQFGHGFTLDLAYLFVKASDLVRGNNMNVPCPVGTSKPNNPYYAQGWLNPDGSLSNCEGTPSLGPFGLGPMFGYLNNPASSYPYNPAGLEFGVPSEADPRPTISAGLLDYNNNVTYARYNGLTVSAIERLGSAFNMTASYTYSHTIDNGNFTTFINLPPNQFDYGAEEANSNQDLRHRFVTNFTYNTPKQGWYRNFTMSSIITLSSGSPFTLFPGANVLGDLAGLSTDRVGGPPLTPDCTSVQHCRTMIPRNTYIGPGLRTWDFHLGREFHFGESKSLALGMDAFNFLNHPNVQEVSSVYGSPVFCGASPVIPRHYNDSVSRAIQAGQVSCATQIAANTGPDGLGFNGGAWILAGGVPVPVPDTPNPTFGKPRTMFNPRQFQFSLRFSF